MAKEKIKSEKKVAATVGAYDILRHPVVSEKSAKLSETNGVAFEIAPTATKADVIRAIQAIYNVKPVKVNIVVIKGKVRSFRGRGRGKERTIKKAYVSLPEDAKIDLSAKV